MKRVSRLRWVTGLWFVVLVMFSQFIIPKNDFVEIYPMFHWSLFSERITGFKHYYLKIKKRDGGECDVFKCGVEFRNPKRVYFMIQEFGKTFKSNDEKKKRQIEYFLKSQFPGVESYYLVVQEQTIERYFSGKEAVREDKVSEVLKL